MKYLCLLILINFIPLICFSGIQQEILTVTPRVEVKNEAVEKPDEVPLKIIPAPKAVEVFGGRLEITPESKLVTKNKKLLPLARFLSDYIARLTGFELSVSSKAGKEGDIILSTARSYKPEEYELKVEKNVTLEGFDLQGVAMASSTLLQVIEEAGGNCFIPRLLVQDEPQYAYRAVMLDLARFWHPVETIQETIDLLWFYKIKYLHLHLSDNRRFTFPLKEYPELKKVNPDGSVEYYTRKQLADLVEYARQRGVIIIPEIDLPGHSQVMWQKLPEVFGAVDPETGKAKNLQVVNMAKEETYQAIESIIGQLAEVFYTSPYIHIGGDEVWLEPIKTLPEYKTYCEKHGLKAALNGDANELFCHFINRLNRMVKKTGKKTIAWEGFHGQGAGDVLIDKDIMVIVWNTTYNRPDSLLKNGFEIVNSTWIPWYQVSAMNFAPEPKQAYAWGPGDWKHWNPDIKDIRLTQTGGITGGQISFWEQNYNRVIEILRDRAPVLAERLWNTTATQNYNEYLDRFTGTNRVYERLFRPVDIQGVTLTNNEDQCFVGETSVKLTFRGKTVKYVYTKDWGIPETEALADYNGPFPVTNSGLVTAQAFDEKGHAIGYPVQKYFTKIEPAYQYRVLRSTHGMNKMPHFSTLPLLRQGVSGRMTAERLQQINRELFAKVKPEGHMEVRFEGLYNPYAVELSGYLEIPSAGKYEWQLQTWDGLVELYIDGKPVAIGKNFDNKPEFFSTDLSQGKYPFIIKYYYKHIQNQLSILYRKEGEGEYLDFESLVLPLTGF